MEDARIRKLETHVNTLNRRFDDHDELHAKDVMWQRSTVERIDKIERTVSLDAEAMAAIHQVADYARKTYEVIEPLAKLAGYAIKIGAASALAWHAVKLLAAKAAIIWS
jgi:hypothetical protein